MLDVGLAQWKEQATICHTPESGLPRFESALSSTFLSLFAVHLSNKARKIHFFKPIKIHFFKKSKC